MYHGQNYETMDLLKSAQFSIEIETKFKLQIDMTHTVNSSYNNVAPVTNLCLGRATTRSHIRHNGAKQNLQLKRKNSLFTLQTFHYNYY